MIEQNLTLTDAIHVAMEAEAAAAAFYTHAATKTATLGHDLLEQLAAFERYHYDLLTKLEQSLRDHGTFIEYEGKEFTVPILSQVPTDKQPDKMSMMGIITTALDIEARAEEGYTALATKTNDAAGKAMFKRLAQEEHKHHQILKEAYVSLNQNGTWVWP